MKITPLPKRKTTPLKLLTLAVAAVAAFALPSPPSQALSNAGWQAGNIIADSVFNDKNAMSEAQIQQFLNAKMPACDNWGTKPYAGTTRRAFSESRGIKFPLTCLKDYHENTTTKANNLEGRPIPAGAKSAARIIWEAAQHHSINPKVLIVLLQKEQSLVTDDWPWPIQFRHATGYACPDTAPCDAQYHGLYNQVESAAWQFRRYATHPNNFNHVAGQHNFIQWSPNGACGGSTVFIHNQATASLYNYTPYQPNHALLNNAPDGCSSYGNLNFWRLFNSWFGSTHHNWAADHVETKFYSDEARTQEIGAIPAMKSGQMVYVTAKYRNSGNLAWSKSFVKLGTTGPHNRASNYHNDSWHSPGRPTVLSESTVEPGQTGTFHFSLAAPNADGTYSERLRVVAEGKAWMTGESLERYNMTVRNPYNAQIVSLRAYKDATYTSPATGMIKVGEPSYWQLRAKNIGANTWSNTTIKVGTDQPKNRPSTLHDGSWPSAARPANLQEASVSPGQIGTFNFSLAPLLEVGNYPEPFQLVAEGIAWMPNAQIDGLFRAFDRFDRLAIDHRLHAGEQLIAGDYRLVLQGDGNLVVYKNNKALWSSGTRKATRLIMQGDGNLVLYDGHKAVWSTGTKGADRIIMQGDGNVVLYGSNKAVWNTGTR